MVGVEMGDDESVNGAFVEPQFREAKAKGFPSRLPVCPTVDQEQTRVRLDNIGIHERWRPERQRGGDLIDAVA
jgi:hypothetical protein